MQAQVNDAAREEIADSIIRNEGSLEDLERIVEDLWNNTLRPLAQGS
jgi:dephospho-CoA kinase